MNPQALFPEQIFTVWHVTVVLALVLLVPAAVYSLHSLWRTTKSIRQYALDSLVATRAIEANTAVLPAINTTIEVAGEILVAADAVARKLDTIAGVLEARAGGRG
jgi:hypothetical protein